MFSWGQSHQNDRKTSLYNSHFYETVHKAIFSLLFKRGVVLAEFVVGFLVQMEPWGLKKACKKFEEKFTKIDTSLYKQW